MTNPLSIADAFLPNFDNYGDKKRLYLSYRLCGFSRDEAMDYAEISRRTLYHWRQKDAAFDEIERTSLPDLRQTFCKEYFFWMYLRTLRLTMAVDAQIFDKALEGIEDLTRKEFALLKKVAPKYTGEKLEALGGYFESLHANSAVPD